MPRTAQDLQHAISALHAQRALLGDQVTDAALVALRAELAALKAPSAQGPQPSAAAPAAGAGMPAPTPEDRQLRLVSVLFLDVVGSTAMSRQIDAEDVHAVMDGALAAFTALVDRHGGHVLQYAGDSLLAVFGAEEVHEDDAERAVLCGLAILSTTQTLASQVQARHPALPRFAVRVGVHSGPVLMGEGVDGQGSVRGETVNMAARMEQSAPPGALRISQDTWRLVRGLFDMQLQAPLFVKGHDAALQTWLVAGVLDEPVSAARRGVDGVHAPLLGRSEELAWLDQVCTARAEAAGPANAQPGLRRVLLLGDAGLGKSRLLQELLARLAQRRPPLAAWVAQAAERQRNRPYGLLRDLLLAVLGLRAQGTTSTPAPGAWQEAAQPWLRKGANADVLGHLLGLPGAQEQALRSPQSDARALRDEAFHIAAHLLQALAAHQGQPLLALDDLHWADEGSLDFLDYLGSLDCLAPGHDERPLCLLLLARPALLDRRPAWGIQATHRLVLSPLPEVASLSLAQSLLRRVAHADSVAAAQLLQTVAQTSEGNPFFMEERVNMLIDTGAIQVEGERWLLRPAALRDKALPTTLQGLLQARLDALPASRRRPLQMAAIIGTAFWDRPLAVLDASAPEGLADLTRRDLIAPQAHSRLHDAREYAFRHHSMHRVAYDSVLKRVKRGAHATLAAWLAQQPDADALADQLAEHLERAGQTQAACLAWQQAAEMASQRFANADALAHVERALALTDAADLAQRPLRLNLTLLRLRVLESLSDREGMAAALTLLSELAHAQGDPAWLSEALVRRSRHEFHFGDAQAALDLAQQALLLAPDDQPERQARAWSEVMQVLCRLARFDDATAAAGHALAYARAAGHRPTEASTLNQLGMLAFDRGDIDAATQHYQSALAIHRAEGYVSNEGGTLCNLAFVALSVGDFDSAQAQFEQSAALCDRVGQRQNRAIIDINLGIVALQQGRPELAAQQAQRALTALQALGDRWAEAAALRVAGQAALQLGQVQQARAWCEQSRDLFDGLKMENLALESIAVLAEVALARGDTATALAQAEAVLERLARGVGVEGTDEPMRIAWATWRALQAAGDTRAAGVLARARAELLARADRLLSPAQRHNFLQRVPCHREILAASGGAAAPGGSTQG